VRYRDAVTFRQALEQRLKDQAGTDGTVLVRYRKRVAFDRLLARLLAVAPRRWLLKGGFALDLRLSARARSTKDVDIEWWAAEGELLEALLDISSYEADDFFQFAIERAGAPDDRLGGSQRFRIAVSLAGRQFETFMLDVGFRIDGAIATEALRTDDLLAFAEIEPVEVDALPLEAQVAEKVHAYTRVYEGGRRSTRTKDLIDLALIAEVSTLDAATLTEQIRTVFMLRDTHLPPGALPPPPAEWRTPFRRLAEEVGAPGELAAGHRGAAALLDPVLGGVVAEGEWDPAQHSWVIGSGGSGQRAARPR
jgi:hypothetical protein